MTKVPRIDLPLSQAKPFFTNVTSRRDGVRDRSRPATTIAPISCKIRMGRHTEETSSSYGQTIKSRRLMQTGKHCQSNQPRVRLLPATSKLQQSLMNNRSWMEMIVE
jgi:hypothetical protein